MWGKAGDMVAFLKSDLFMKFMGGFVLGTIGVLTLQPGASVQSANAETSAQPAPVMQDATL